MDAQRTSPLIVPEKMVIIDNDSAEASLQYAGTGDPHGGVIARLAA